MPKTFSYVGCVEEEIQVGEEYYFGQLVDGEGNSKELLEEGCVGISSDIVSFDIIEKCEDVLKTIVSVTDIY